MTCQVHFWLYVSMGSLQSTVGLLRLLQLLNMARFARGARRMKRIIVDDKSDASSIKTSTRSNFQNAAQDIWAVGKILKTITFSFGFGASARRAARGGNQHKDYTADVLALELSTESLKPITMIAVFCIAYVPTLICIVVVFTVVDPYRSTSCSGCDVFGEELICINGLYFAVLIARARLAMLVKDEPDPDGVIAELKLSSMVLLPCIFIGVVLLCVDPNYCWFFPPMYIYIYIYIGAYTGNELTREPNPDDYNMVIAFVLPFSAWCFLPVYTFRFFFLFCVDACMANALFRYEWWLAFGLMGVFIISVPMQIYLALKERKQRQQHTRRASKEIPEPQVALKNPLIFNRFEAFAEESFCSESVAFIADAWGWKGQFTERSEDWRRLKAKAIVNMYIVQYSLLQVNIPSRMRVAIEDELASNNIQETLLVFSVFLRILKELWKLTRRIIIKTGLTMRLTS